MMNFMKLSMAPVYAGRYGDSYIYECGECTVLVSGPQERAHLGKWHFSISHPDRYPTWDEQHAARYGIPILPQDITFAMYMVPKEDYVNLHPNCFHWYEAQQPE